MTDLIKNLFPIRSFSLFVAYLLSSFSIFAQPPLNLAIAKRNVAEYYNSGEYNQDIIHAIAPGKSLLKKHMLGNKNNKKLALVFDVDETAISGYSYMKKNDMGEPKEYIDYIMQNSNEPIRPVLNLYRYAQKNGVSVFFLTGRYESMRESTIRNLKTAGYENWTHLYMRPNNEHNSAITFKTRMRKEITDQGYEIVLNIGDQDSDLIGNYAKMGIKLPNPFYLVA